jgi:ABC-2 type transporter
MKTIPKAEVPGLTKAQNSIQIGVLIAVSIITVWTLYMVPSWQVPGDLFLLAAVVGAVTVACLWLTRWLGSRAMKFERTMLAAFLVGMPLVYVTGWFAARDHAASSWIWVKERIVVYFHPWELDPDQPRISGKINLVCVTTQTSGGWKTDCIIFSKPTHLHPWPAIPIARNQGEFFKPSAAKAAKSANPRSSTHTPGGGVVWM